MGSRVPMQPDVSISAFTAPRIVSTSLFCGWSSFWGGSRSQGRNARTPSPQDVRGGAMRSGADALLHLWGSSDRWLAILELNWRVESKKSEVRSLWRKGLPPYLRGKVWKKAIGNKLSIEIDLFEYNRNHAGAALHPAQAPAVSAASVAPVAVAGEGTAFMNLGPVNGSDSHPSSAIAMGEGGGETHTATMFAVTNQASSGWGSLRSPSPWFVQDERSSSAQPLATRTGSDVFANEQRQGMRSVSSSGHLLTSEDYENANGTQQATWLDWNLSGGASGAILRHTKCGCLLFEGSLSYFS